MRRAVMWPWLLRPPDLRRPSVSALTGSPLCMSERSTMTSWRWLGVVGLNVLSAIASDSRRHVDGVALGQGHHRPLEIRALPDMALEPLGLAHHAQRVDRGHLDVDHAFDGGLDLRLGGLERDPEGHLV